jgi:hypothetical protein
LSHGDLTPGICAPLDQGIDGVVILKWHVVLWCGLDKCGLEYGLEVGFYECCFESLGSIEDIIFWLTERLFSFSSGIPFHGVVQQRGLNQRQISL